jgi:AraC-like DNA-binding protein
MDRAMAGIRQAMPRVTTMTELAEKATSHPLNGGSIGATALAFHPADESARLPGQTALRHDHFRSADPAAARQFFASAYTPGWQVPALAKGAAVSHRRHESAWMTLDEIRIQGHAKYEISCGETVLVIQPRAGMLTVPGEPLPDKDSPLLLAGDAACALEANTARFDVVSIPADVLRKAAAERQVPLPRRIQFLDSRPRSRLAVRAWHRALEYVSATFRSAETARQPLIVASAGTLLAAVLLDSYPTNVAVEHDLLSDPSVPGALKAAVSFIHSHAGSDIGINDVAAAVHLTPRAVQYLFRQQLDTTPTEYQRRVRLHCAHHELKVADRSAITVAEIAQRWGFTHAGRFSVLYRETYGQSPHSTLRL